MAIKLCPNCGARINEKNLFCDYCGSMQVKEEPKKPKQPQIICIINIMKNFQRFICSESNKIQ